MKSVAAIRKIDRVGRFAIPKKVMRSLDIKIGDNVGVWMESSNIIIIQKIQDEYCVFCNDKKNLLPVKISGKSICKTCFELLEASQKD